MEIVFPKNNEKEFVSLAEKLDIRDLFFVYPFVKDITVLNSKIKELQSSTKINLVLGLLAESKDIPRAKQKSSFVVIKSSDKDQHVLEKFRPNLIFGLEHNPKKEPTHFRFSGLNQILCKLAFKNKTIIGFELKDVLSLNPVVLGRIMQNIRLCKKYKVDFVLASFSSDPFLMRSEMHKASLLKVLNQ